MATTTRLTIEGDVVTREEIEKLPDGERVRRSRVKLEEWLAKIKAQEGQLEFLPPLSCGHIIARQVKGDHSCVVVQLPPAVRSFYYSPHDRLYRVAMPYIVLAIRSIGQAIDGTSSANRCGIYWFYRNEPVCSLDDPLFFSNMPNVYDNGQICWGNERIPLDAPMAKKIELVVRALFASHFNQHELDYQWYPAKSIPGHPQKFEEWETRSNEDPNFVLKLQWRSAGLTVRQMLEKGVR